MRPVPPAHRIRWQRAWAFFPVADGLELRCYRDRRRLSLTGPPEALGRFAERLADGLDEAAAADLSAAQQRLLTRLYDAGALITVPDDEPPPVGKQPGRGLYDPQREFFDRWERPGRSGWAMDAALRSSRVAIVGLGGLGSWITLVLARTGVGEIRALDDDRVERSNLSRQVLYDRADVGSPKVVAAERALRGADPGIRFRGVQRRVRCAADLADVLPGSDLVILPLGFAPERNRDAAARACVDAGVPFLTAGAFQIGPLWRGAGGACYGCANAADDDTRVAVERQPAAGWVPPAAPFAPFLATAGALAAWEAAKFLSGYTRPLCDDAVLLVDGHSGRMTTRPAGRDPRCGICAPAKAAGRP